MRRSNLLIASHVVATQSLAAQVLALHSGEALVSRDDAHEVIAFNGNAQDFDARSYSRTIVADEEVTSVHWLYDLFELNGRVLKADFERLTAGRKSASLSPTVTVVGPRDRVFLEAGAWAEACVLNTHDGPIYLGRDTEVMEGACIRGPFAAGHDAKVRIGAKVYGATTLGPHCKIGGEVENSIFIGYSNKAHEGFLGDAVIGEWCNIGGGTTASNLKNDYSEIKLWNYGARRFLPTGLQFCGLFMGDHSKLGVNCMINTATVLGVGVNIHGAGFPRPFVASFQEGSATSGFKAVQLEGFYATASRVLARRGLELTDVDRQILADIYQISKKYHG